MDNKLLRIEIQETRCTYYLQRYSLTLTTLCANSADDTFGDNFLIFPIQQVLTFHANCLLCMKCQNLFSGKNKKKDLKMSSVEIFTQRAKR